MMLTRIIITAALFAIALTSCSGSDKEQGPSAKEAVTGYTKTLSKARDEAEDVARQLKERGGAEVPDESQPRP